MWTRRDILKLGLGTALLHTPLRAGASRRRSKTRYFLTIVLGGGLDAILTTDPKSRAEVESWIDVPFNANDITTRGGSPVGPLLKPIAESSASLSAALLNGVVVSTASHPAGLLQLARMKLGGDRRVPTIYDVIAAHREDQPLGTLTMGALSPLNYSPGWFGDAARSDGLLGRIDGAAPADLEKMARALRTNGERLMGRNPESERTARNILEAANLFSRLVTVPPFKDDVWSEDPMEQDFAFLFQRVLWALEHDLVKCINWELGQFWDSHSFNLSIQRQITRPFIASFARFLAELDHRRTPWGPLSKLTTIVVGSELGRFPRLNTSEGKDHFPEAPYMLFGPDFNTRDKKVMHYGATGRQMEALPVSLKTGAIERSNGQLLCLDDLGTTLLHVAGVNPSVYGYAGRVLDFLVA